MGCQRLFDSAGIGYFGKITIHLLIGQHRQNNAFCYTGRMLPVFVGYGSCRFQIRDAAHILRFLTGLVYPVIAFVINGDMFGLECSHIGECQTGQRAEHEYVTHLRQPVNLGFLVDERGKLFLGEMCFSP